MPFPELFRDDVFHIETKRLWLRWPRALDVKALYRFAALAEVAEMTATWPHPFPETEVDRRILAFREANAAGTALVLAITRKKEPDRLIGTVGLDRIGDRRLGLGYLLDPLWRGRGFMPEAVHALVDLAFAYTPALSIEGSSWLMNPASRRVFEKSGFAHVNDRMQDAPARGTEMPANEFVLRRVDWLAQRDASAAARRKAA